MGRRIKPDRDFGNRPKGLRELAVALNVSYEKARKLRRDGLQANPDGTFDIAKARTFLASRAACATAWAQTPAAIEWRDRRLKAKALLAEIEVSQLYRQLVSRHDVIMEWRRALLRVKNLLIGLGRQQAPLLVGKNPQQIQVAIDERVRQILLELAHPEYLPNGEELAGTDNGSTIT